MRDYDPKLIHKIRKKQYKSVQDHTEIVFKPIPDDDRKNIMDPRVYDIAVKKYERSQQGKAAGWSLSHERHRPDKISYDLTSSNIVIKEQLINIADTHMIDVYSFHPETDEKHLPVIIYLHGGGMTAGDISLYKNQMKLVCELSQAVVVFPEYRLAPENPFPCAIDDVFGVIEWVSKSSGELNIDPQKICVVGDSAGAVLTNACLLRDKLSLIKRAVEIYPSVDFKHPETQDLYQWSYDYYPVIDEQKKIVYSRIDRIKNSMTLSESDNLFLQGKTTFDNPEVSVVHASDEALMSFPPLTIIAAEYDYLRVGSDYFADRLVTLGKEVTSIRYQGCDHGFFDFLGIIAQAEELCHVIAEEVKMIS